MRVAKAKTHCPRLFHVSPCEAARKRIVISARRDVSKTKARLTKTRGAQRRKRLNLSLLLCAPRVLVSRVTLFYFRLAWDSVRLGDARELNLTHFTNTVG